MADIHIPILNTNDKYNYSYSNSYIIWLIAYILISISIVYEELKK